MSSFNPSTSTIHLIGLSCNPIPPPNYGGIELVITNLAVGFSQNHVKTICYCPGEFGLFLKRVSQCKTLTDVTLGPKDGLREINTSKHMFNVAKGLFKHYRKGDIILLNNTDHDAFFSNRASYKNPFRKYIDLIGHFYHKRWNVFELAHWNGVGRADKIIYPSQALMDEVKKPGKMIPHPVNLDCFFPEPDSNLQDQYGDFIFYAGVIHPRKGVHIAAEAAQKAGIRLVLAGPITDPDYAEGFIPDTTYIGTLTPKQLRPYYSSARGVVYLSQYNEPFGLVPVEAMACGAPVIVSGQGGTGETVIPHTTGFYCDDVEQVVRAMQQLDTIDKNACVKHAQTYNCQTIAKQYLQHFQSCNS